MKIIKLWEFAKQLVGLAAKASGAGNENGAAIDKRTLQEFLSGGVDINVGAATGTPDSFSIIFRAQHCDTEGGTYEDLTTVTATAAGPYKLSFNPGATKRWVRVRRETTITGGTSPTVPNSANFLFADPKYGPA